MIQTRNVALFSPTNQSGVYFASWESGKKLCTTKNTIIFCSLIGQKSDSGSSDWMRVTALTASLWG